MKRTILIAIDVEDTYEDGESVGTTDDLALAVVARLDEMYPNDVVEPTNHRVSVMNPDALRTLLDAADVGLEGAEDAGVDELDVAHAGQMVDDLRKAYLDD